jgi:hypothetical protein
VANPSLTRFEPRGVLGLAIGYFAFVNLNIATLRIRLLKELLKPRKAHASDLLRRYGATEVLRGACPVGGREAAELKDGRYFPQPGVPDPGPVMETQ